MYLKRSQDTTWADISMVYTHYKYVQVEPITSQLVLLVNYKGIVLTDLLPISFQDSFMRIFTLNKLTSMRVLELKKLDRTRKGTYQMPYRKYPSEPRVD